VVSGEEVDGVIWCLFEGYWKYYYELENPETGGL
jgi:hypothetical protein